MIHYWHNFVLLVVVMLVCFDCEDPFSLHMFDCLFAGTLTTVNKSQLSMAIQIPAHRPTWSMVLTHAEPCRLGTPRHVAWVNSN